MTAMMDQAQSLRELVAHRPVVHGATAPAVAATSARTTNLVRTPVEEVPAPTPALRVMAVTSGKGGVGKSNIAVNLAVLLARAGQRVVLIDADLGTANADLLCNVQPPYNLAHVVAGRRTLQEVMVDAPGGFRLVAGASGLANMAALGKREHDRLVEEIYLLEHIADTVIIDTGAGVGPNVLGFACTAQQQLVVVTPEPTSVMDGYALIKTAARRVAGITNAASERQDEIGPSLDIQVIVNCVLASREARDVFDRLSLACHRFLDLPIQAIGHLPTDMHVLRAVRARRPFVLEAPDAPATRALEGVARQLMSQARRAPAIAR